MQCMNKKTQQQFASRTLCADYVTKSKKKLVSEEFTGFNWIWTGEDSLLQTYANPHSCRKRDRACSQSCSLKTTSWCHLAVYSNFQLTLLNWKKNKISTNFNKYHMQIFAWKICGEDLLKVPIKWKISTGGIFHPAKCETPHFSYTTKPH